MTSAAFFDLDKTIIAKSSALAFGKPLYRAGFVNRRMVAKAAIAQVVYSAFGADHDRMEQVRERMIALIRGWNATELRSLAAEAIEEVVAPLVYQEALELYTINNARILGLEDRRGSLEAGKDADLAVLDQDILEVAPDEIRNTKALLTMVGGKVVWREGM